MYGDWRLIYDGTDFRFGTKGHPVEFVKLTASGDVFRTDDSALPRRDGTAFGQDFVEAGQLAISLKIDFTDHPAGPEECARLAWEARQAFEQVWRADPVRNTPGALCELVMGGEQVIEGRPRGVTWTDDFQGVGLITGSALFVPAGTGVFAADGLGWHSVTLGLIPAQVGGLMAPLMEPLRTAVESSRAAPVVVRGQVPAWPVIELTGPIQVGASVECGRRWSLILNRGLAWDQTALIDTRPGRAFTKLNGRAVQLLDARSSLISQASLEPGQNVIALRGASIEGTAKVVVSWRETKAGI